MRTDYSGGTTKILAGIAVLLAAAVGGGFYYLIYSADTKLPDFAGKSRTEVLDWAGKNRIGEERITFEREYDEEKDADIVLSQSIPAGEVFADEDTLSVVLSGGPDPEKEFVLPDFAGKSRTEIETWFRDSRFSAVSYVTKAHRTIAEDIMTEMNPPAGATVKRKDAVVITISAGDDPSLKDVEVPDFSSYIKTEIESWGKTNRINITIKEEPSETITKGNFIRQSVKAGDTLYFDDPLEVVFSSGKPAAVENFVGKSKDQAAAWVGGTKFDGRFVEVYGDADPGLIVRQNPAGGTQGEEEPVWFYVSVGYVQIADNTGKTKDVALGFLSWTNEQYNSSANIRWEINEEFSKNPEGTVIAQYLNGELQKGTKYCSPGSIVSYTISKGDPDGTAPDTTPAPAPTQDSGALENCAGWSEEDFLNRLAALSLSAGTRTAVNSSDTPAGHIISNEYGVKPAGTQISYTVSLGPENTPAPTQTPTAAPTEQPASPGELKLPNISAYLSMYDGEEYDSIVSKITELFVNAGFRESDLTFRKVTNANNYKGIKSISPNPDGSPYQTGKPIIIEVYVSQE